MENQKSFKNFIRCYNCNRNLSINNFNLKISFKPKICDNCFVLFKSEQIIEILENKMSRDLCIFILTYFGS